MALLFVGKLLIALGLCFQAYTLFQNKATATQFDTRLATVLTSCDCIPAEIQTHLRQHLRLVVVAFLGFSGLMVLVRSCLVKIPVLLGLVTLLLVKYWPITAVPSYKDQPFWQLLATIGGIVYLMGADNSCCTTKTTHTSSSSSKS